MENMYQKLTCWSGGIPIKVVSLNFIKYELCQFTYLPYPGFFV